jgi:integrase
MLDGLLLTGMRYVEARRFQASPDWLEGKFIHTPTLKAKAKQTERWIRLSNYGQQVIPLFLKGAKLPGKATFNANLKRWARKAGLDHVGLSAKATRKTWESWLMFYYPERQINVVQSQGHNTLTSLDHYLNLPFENAEKATMQKWLEGWI